MAGFQSPITISQAIDRIRRKEYLLPVFQREFVWTADQIEKLFDSLMKGYPISSMLFWKVKGETKTDFRFYEFLSHYVQIHKTHNNLIDTGHINDFHAILDGQQRLTALNIGLCGSFAYKEYRKSYEYSERSYPTRHLYLNISKTFSPEENEKQYLFLFINKIDSQEKDLYVDQNGYMWFRVGKILSLHIDAEYDLDDFCEEHNIGRDAKKMLKRLDNVIFTDLNINFYEEDEQIPDKAVNIFVRINSGGTHLSFSDILMSIAVANWKTKDARGEIYSLVDTVRQKGFNIDKDYVLKAFLFLHHRDVRSIITNFNNGFIEKIETNWDAIRDAILSLFDFIKSTGLNDYTLTSHNATLPILYYIYHKNIYTDFTSRIVYTEERAQIKKWIFTILIRKTFGAQTDSILSQARRAYTENIDDNYMKPYDLFPSNEINSGIKKMSDIGDEYIEELLLTQKDSRYSFPILAMLYPNLDYKNNSFHQDHMHPEASYEALPQAAKDNLGWKCYNSILNLQMLDANENMSKQDISLQQWVDGQTQVGDRNSFLDNHIIPRDASLSLNNFEDFIKKRKAILTEKIKALIS